MTKIDVLIDLFFKDLRFGQRVEKIAACGYRYIETWGGGDAFALKEMSDAGKSVGVELVSIVMNFATQDDVAPIRKENLKRFVDQMDRYADNALAAGYCDDRAVSGGSDLSGTTFGIDPCRACSRGNDGGQRISLERGDVEHRSGSSWILSRFSPGRCGDPQGSRIGYCQNAL